MLSTENILNANQPGSGHDRCVFPVRRHHHRHNVKSRYEFIRTLGKGTYGKVKLARHRETNKLVAVKAIKKDKIKENVDMQRIRREMEIMSTIQHRHIIQIYEVFENYDKIVIVMEYAAGGELYDYLASKRGISDEEAKSFFRQIVSAVRYCHKMGIVHRDLKLENILLNDDNQIKIADFGLANIFKSDSLLHTFCGSPLYASPEIVSGVPYVGPEVDSWSLGVLLYALVYGTMPFDGRDFHVLTRHITNGEICKPPKESGAHPLILAMLTVDPTKRATVDEVAFHSWMKATKDPVPPSPAATSKSLQYAAYLDAGLDGADSGCRICDEEAKGKDMDESTSNQPKGILKRKPLTNGTTPKKAPAKPQQRQQPPKSTVDANLAGQLAAVCGLHAKDSLKLKARPQSASGKRRVMRSKRERESGYYSSPERPAHITTNSHPSTIPQIKSPLTPSGANQTLRAVKSSPPCSSLQSNSSKEHILAPASPGTEDGLVMIGDDGSSNGSQTRPASTYSDSSILSSDSFDLCTFNRSLLPPSGALHQQNTDSRVCTTSPPTRRPLALSLVPDTLPPMPESLSEDPAPGALTPNSEKLVRDLKRILAPNGRRSHSRQNRATYNNDVTKRPQLLDETSQLSAMMNQLNLDLELAYKRAFDICANLKSADV